MTRTHTVFFGDETLAKLEAAQEELNRDWVSRAPYMQQEAREAGYRRLYLLAGAIDLLKEPVPE